MAHYPTRPKASSGQRHPCPAISCGAKARCRQGSGPNRGRCPVEHRGKFRLSVHLSVCPSILEMSWISLCIAWARFWLALASLWEAQTSLLAAWASLSQSKLASEQPEPALEQPDPASERRELAWRRGQMDRWMDKQTDKQMDGLTESPPVFYRKLSPIGSADQKRISKTKRQKNRGASAVKSQWYHFRLKLSHH